MNGVINLLKPPAMSSGQAVGAVRKLLGVKKAGHTGTLDPGAAGVLPICVGRATKIADYIMNGDKEYIAEMTAGAHTDTLDSYGAVVQRSGAGIAAERLKEVIPRFTGEIMQAPPMYSALKVGGVPLYKLARKGRQITGKPPRKVGIRSIEILSGQENRFLLRIVCSKGTYIRSLISDMAQELGGLAYTSFLMRTRTGGFSIEDTVTLHELGADPGNALIPPEDALSFMPKIELRDHLFDIVTTGTAIDVERAGLRLAGEGCSYIVYCKATLIGIGEGIGNQLKIKTSLYTR